MNRNIKASLSIYISHLLISSLALSLQSFLILMSLFVDAPTCPCLVALTQGISPATCYFSKAFILQKAAFPPPDLTELVAVAECTGQTG